MQNEDDKKWLYEQFKNNGYDTGSYEDFTKSLDNDEDFDWWHKEALNLGLEVGDIKEFGELFRTPKQASSEEAAPVAPAPVVMNPQQIVEPAPAVPAQEAAPAVEAPTATQAAPKAEPAPQPALPEVEVQDPTGFGLYKPAEPTDEPQVPYAPENAEQMRDEYVAQRQADEEVRKYGTGNADYTFEDAVAAGKEAETLMPEIDAFDQRLADFNTKYKPLEEKIELINAGKMKVSPAEYEQMRKDYEDYTRESNALTEIANRYDALMQTAPGQEYKAISDRMNAIAQGPKTAESALEYAEEYAKLQRNPIYRATLGKDAPSEDEIQSNLLQGQLAYVEEKLKTAKVDEKKNLKKMFSETKRELYANPYYQKYIQGAIAKNEGENKNIGLQRAARYEQVYQEWLAKNFPYLNILLNATGTGVTNSIGSPVTA